MFQSKGKTYFTLIFALAILFLWYYTTLPNSMMFADENKQIPSLKTALISYSAYVGPMVIGYLYILNSKK